VFSPICGWVNPSLVCPILGSPGIDPDGSDSPVASVAGAKETSSPNTFWDYSDPDCSKEDVLSPSSEAGKVQERELLGQPQASCALNDPARTNELAQQLCERLPPVSTGVSQRTEPV